MRVGIIGSGQIARVHGPLILKQPNAEIVGIADTDITRAKALAKELKASRFYQDAKVMIEEQKPNVVHVLVPPQYHADLSIMAMDQGCNVLVEKPMALNMDDAERMIEVAKQNNVHLCVNHNMVFMDVVQRAMELTSKGAIGEVLSVEAYYCYDARRNSAISEEGAEYAHWSYRLNGGLLEDLMPHMAALIFEFIPEIQDVHNIGHNRGVLPKGWQDEIRVLLKSKSVIGNISISLNERPDIILLTIKGTRGIIRADLYNNILTIQKKSGLPRAIARGLSGFQLSFQYLKESLGNSYKFVTGRIDKSSGMELLISKFYAAILNGGETPVSLDKSLRVVDLVKRIWSVPSVDAENINLLPSLSKNNSVEPTVFVTGASGFIGTHLIKRLLSENIGVRALVRPNSIHAGRLRKLDVDIVEGDLSNAELLCQATKGIKTIYHAGAATNNNWEDNYQSTVKGTEHLIKAALSSEVERFIHLSTLAVYELVSIKKNGLIKEDSPFHRNPEGMGAYAYSKIETERLVFDAYREEGLRVTVIRPGIVIGPLGYVFFPHLGYRYQDRLFILIGKGDTILPITYVENTVDGIYKASIEEKAIGQVYNLVDDGEITVREYLEKFIEITGIQARIISLPYTIPYLATTAYEIAAHFDLLKKGATSRTQLKTKQARVRFDNTKARNELGWSPKISLKEGLIRTFKWYADRYG